MLNQLAPISFVAIVLSLCLTFVQRVSAQVEGLGQQKIEQALQLLKEGGGGELGVLIHEKIEKEIASGMLAIVPRTPDGTNTGGEARIVPVEKTYEIMVNTNREIGDIASTVVHERIHLTHEYEVSNLPPQQFAEFSASRETYVAVVKGKKAIANLSSKEHREYFLGLAESMCSEYIAFTNQAKIQGPKIKSRVWNDENLADFLEGEYVTSKTGLLAPRSLMVKIFGICKDASSMWNHFSIVKSRKDLYQEFLRVNANMLTPQNSSSASVRKTRATSSLIAN